MGFAGGYGMAQLWVQADDYLNGKTSPTHLPTPLTSIVWTDDLVSATISVNPTIYSGFGNVILVMKSGSEPESTTDGTVLTGMSATVTTEGTYYVRAFPGADSIHLASDSMKVLAEANVPTPKLVESFNGTGNPYVENYADYGITISDSGSVTNPNNFTFHLSINDGAFAVAVLTGYVNGSLKGIGFSGMDDPEHEIYKVYVSTSDGKVSDTSYVGVYAPLPTVPTPTLSLSRSGSTVNGSVGNLLSGATYRYKIGSAPTSATDGSPVTNGSFSFTNSSYLTVYVRGFMDGYNMSEYAMASVDSYTPQCATPSISFSSSSNRVTITCSTSGATIYYSKGGGSYIAYAGSFTISSSTTIYAYATAPGYTTSATTSRYCAYTDPTPSLPTPQLTLTDLSDSEEYYFTVKIDNYSSFPSGTSFSVVWNEHQPGQQLPHQSVVAGLWGVYTNSSGTHSVTVTASKSGYKSSSATASVYIKPR